MRRDVSAMCNLGEGIEEKGIAIGRETTGCIPKRNKL